MFDLISSVATVQPLTITTVITPGTRVDAIALLGLVANSVTISITSGGATVYTHTEKLNTREVFNWYDYFFRPFSTKKGIALFDLPPYTNAIITITISATSGNAECGYCVLGLQEYIGAVQFDAESDVLNFSTVTRDFAGNTSEMVQRRNVPKTIQSIFCDKSRVNRIRALRDALNGAPAVWSGLDDSNSDGYFESLLILGFYKRFSISLKHPTKAVVSLDVEEI